MAANFQIETWQSDFGKQYTDRNTFELNELEALYVQKYGIGRKQMNEEFLGDLRLKDKPILEVGCNVANQLRLLESEGYHSLYGIELQPYAVQRARELSNTVNVIVGSADNIPFKDNYFEVVFTSGVLIHISPEDIQKVVREIYRVSNRYIWIFESFAQQYTEVNYRGNHNLYWKTDFEKIFSEVCPNLKLLKSVQYKYVNEDLSETMFLMEKKV